MYKIKCQKCGQLKRKIGEHICPTSEQLSVAHKGIKVSDETKKKMALAQTGRVHSEDTKLKIAKAHLGKKRKPFSLKWKQKMSENRKGYKHPNWKGGITPENKKIRQSSEYKLWRIAVFERDNYTCIWCGARSGYGRAVVLNADHIKPFSLFPELRFAIDNGRTLCESCHRKTDTFMGRVKTYKVICERI